MQQIQRFLSGWFATYRQQGCIGKVILVVFSLASVCLLCALPIIIFSPSNSPPNDTVSTPQDISNAETAAAKTTIAEIRQTATAIIQTLTFTPSIGFTATGLAEPTFTETPIAISTAGQLATLSSLGVSCVPTVTKLEEGLVVGIVDGDTIDVDIDGEKFRVRYIGIDTPEKDESLYSQATDLNQALVFSKKVLLVNDVSEIDRYGRLLRYVFVSHTFVNYELVRQGYALASTYPPDVACSEYFAAAQRQALSAKVGLWMPIPTTPAPIIPVVGGSSGSGGSDSNCDPSYPTVCIPPRPPDLDCGEIPYRDFQVRPPDPHGFDRDKDGIGCES